MCLCTSVANCVSKIPYLCFIAICKPSRLCLSTKISLQQPTPTALRVQIAMLLLLTASDVRAILLVFLSPRVTIVKCRFPYRPRYFFPNSPYEALPNSIRFHNFDISTAAVVSLSHRISHSQGFSSSGHLSQQVYGDRREEMHAAEQHPPSSISACPVDMNHIPLTRGSRSLIVFRFTPDSLARSLAPET